MNPKEKVLVIFTETFLEDSYHVFSESDLKLLAKVIAENPECGTATQEIPMLRSILWQSVTRKSPMYVVWYLAVPNLPHIEIIALTTPSDLVADDTNVLSATWKVFRIGMILKTIYKSFEYITHHIHIS